MWAKLSQLSKRYGGKHSNISPRSTLRACSSMFPAFSPRPAWRILIFRAFVKHSSRRSARGAGAFVQNCLNVFQRVQIRGGGVVCGDTRQGRDASFRVRAELRHRRFHRQRLLSHSLTGFGAIWTTCSLYLPQFRQHMDRSLVKHWPISDKFGSARPKVANGGQNGAKLGHSSPKLVNFSQIGRLGQSQPKLVNLGQLRRNLAKSGEQWLGPAIPTLDQILANSPMFGKA